MVSLPLTAHRVRFQKIDHTFTSEEAVTNLGSLKPGDAVNIETDIMAKYVNRLTSFTNVEHVPNNWVS